MPSDAMTGRLVRWAILGAGRIAAVVGADIVGTPGNEVVAVGARSESRAADLAARLGAPRSYGSYEELVADAEADIVYIATTHPQHLEHAMLALRAGKPVLIEKPVALTAADAAAIFAEARSRGLFCMEGMWMRANPLIQKAQAIVASGRIGDVVGVHAELSHHFPYDPSDRLYDPRLGGGSLLDLGVYTHTFAWMFLGRPDAVTTTGSLAPTGVDQTAASQWTYDDGRYAQISSSTRGTGLQRATVYGTDGWIQANGPFYRPTSLVIHTGDGVEDAPEEVLTIELADSGYGFEIQEAERSLRAGLLESPFFPTDETVAILALIDSARAALGVVYPVQGG